MQAQPDNELRQLKKVETEWPRSLLHQIGPGTGCHKPTDFQTFLIRGIHSKVCVRRLVLPIHSPETGSQNLESKARRFSATGKVGRFRRSVIVP